MLLQVLKIRLATAITTVPSCQGWTSVAMITSASTAGAGLVATWTNFVHPIDDYEPPAGAMVILRPLSAFIFPSLVEELFWRGALLPTPSLYQVSFQTAFVVLLVHVLSHPIAAMTVWPRGKHVFCDWRFLTLATIVLGGATWSYIASSGSIWAAALTHGLPVALWRDFFGGERLLQMGRAVSRNDAAPDHDGDDPST